MGDMAGAEQFHRRTDLAQRRRHGLTRLEVGNGEQDALLHGHAVTALSAVSTGTCGSLPFTRNHSRPAEHAPMNEHQPHSGPVAAGYSPVSRARCICRAIRRTLSRYSDFATSLRVVLCMATVQV